MSSANLLLLLLTASALTIESIAYDSELSQRKPSSPPPAHAPTPHSHLRLDMMAEASKHKPIHPHPPAPAPSPKHVADEDQLLARKRHPPAPSKPPKISPSVSGKN
ncbi:hypothetical protein F511_03904 [Dorcoceras hygrometricum]|uniref:Uncharacterized protein n=1 Tax=Dorcoceras hygrometricum TaxID=472368 RepID=A0A2Z7DED3_9LAMI|nr:hypothetical protein F511_03904 [Dorcoceras hygrometricum]